MRRVCLFAIVMAAAACGPGASDSTGGGGGGGGGAGGGADGGSQCVGGACVNHCPNGTQTSISGIVTAPNGIDPIPGAMVYVPRELPEFSSEVACEICGDTLANAMVLTKTAPDGTFTLGPLPTREGAQPGEPIQVVAQKGRFRRVVDLPIEAPCEANALPDDVFHLPGRSDGPNTIPRIAVATGDYDAMECVLLRIGLEEGQFDLFEGSTFTGSGLPGFNQLVSDPARMRGYNIIFINCTEDTWEAMLSQETIRNNVRDYVAGGGRLYVTDWSYDWIEQVAEFSPVIDYEPGMSTAAPEARDAATVGAGDEVVQADVLDGDMAEWLRAVEVRAGEEVISDAGQVRVEHFLGGWVEQLAVTADEHTKVWIDANIGGMSDRPLTTTYDHNECGRWLYSSYHTAGRDFGDFGDPYDPYGDPLDGGTFPSYCGTGGLSPQERVLEYLILHVADCVQVE